MEIKPVTVHLRRPEGSDPGQVSFGFYVVENGRIIMVDEDGAPILNEANGEKYTYKIEDGDNVPGIAGQLTLEIRQMMRGENAPGAVSGFNRQLDYPKSGLA